MDDPKMLGKLTLDELLRLFGPVVYENHRPIVVIDADKEPQHVPFPYATTEYGDSA